MNRTTTATVLGALALGSALTLIVQRGRAAGAPETGALTYSGHVTTADGTPVDGSTSIAVAMYTEAEGGDPVCEAGGPRVAVENGNFRIPLPDACTSAVKATPDLWVAVAVEGSFVARTKLGAVPYALEAARAAVAAHAEATDTAESATRADEARAVSNDALFTVTDCTYATAEGHTDCVCPEDAAVLSGSACASFDCVGETGVTLTSTAVDRRTWRVECKNPGGGRVQCEDASATCLRVR